MRWQAALLALVAGCADWGRPPLTAPYRAGEPLIQEQGLVGIASDESAAAVQLVDAEGAPPRLDLIALDAGGGTTSQIAVAPEKTARAVALRLRADGRKAVSLLAAIATEEWPEALARAAGEGFVRVPPAATRSGAREWFVPAAAHGTAAPPLLLREARHVRGCTRFVMMGRRRSPMPAHDFVLPERPLKVHPHFVRVSWIWGVFCAALGLGAGHVQLEMLVVRQRQTAFASVRTGQGYLASRLSCLARNLSGQNLQQRDGLIRGLHLVQRDQASVCNGPAGSATPHR